MVDVKCLSDCELQNQLEKLGFLPGPILPSTRKVYEKKLVQLLVSPPCTPPVPNGPRKSNGPQDKSEAFNVLLKEKLKLSTEKCKELKKRPKIANIKTKAGDFYYCGRKIPKRSRSAARAPQTRINLDTVSEDCLCSALGHGMTQECDECCFPMGLKLAILGILLIVVFVYLTVEREPLFR
uniref:LEM domain-containing protein 1 n=1 Tax=Urocitellus parryii TaxID=9999 RepID=UPI000E55D86A|nr:LEM domain-containing protein 1 [Urocitellus parryii]